MAGTFIFVMEPSAPPTKRKGRSPRYPGIDLELAIQRATTLWKHEALYPTNVQTALSHWGYAPKSGGGAVAIAALKSFGLITDKGTGDARTVQLSERAQTIIVSEDPVQVREETQAAALAPTAHQDLWTRYGPQLPSDESLKLYLMRERGFTPSGAAELISEYKRTIAFAGLTERGATVSADAADEDDLPEQSAVPIERVARTWQLYGGGIANPVSEANLSRHALMGSAATMLEIPVPLAGEGFARVSLPARMSPRAWAQLIAVLDAYKAGIVSDDESDPRIDPSTD